MGLNLPDSPDGAKAMLLLVADLVEVGVLVEDAPREASSQGRTVWAWNLYGLDRLFMLWWHHMSPLCTKPEPWHRRAVTWVLRRKPELPFHEGLFLTSGWPADPFHVVWAAWMSDRQAAIARQRTIAQLMTCRTSP